MTFSNLRQAAVQLVAAALGAVMIVVSGAAHAGYLETVVGHTSTKTYTYDAWQGERIEVTINGDDDSDVDLRIRDPYGNVVCRGIGPTDYETCLVFARHSGEYKIELVNRGRANLVSLWVE